jgi:hypothetical protein
MPLHEGITITTRAIIESTGWRMEWNTQKCIQLSHHTAPARSTECKVEKEEKSARVARLGNQKRL